MSEHNPDCDVNDMNAEGIKNPCNCGDSRSVTCGVCGGLGSHPAFDGEGNETGSEQCEACGGEGYRTPNQLTHVIPQIIDEPRKAGCAEGNETIGYLAGEISRLRSELKRIAEANPNSWDELKDDFQVWAQKQARHALENNKGQRSGIADGLEVE